MPITGELYGWNKDNVSKVATDGATYAFFDTNRECIYIGSSGNLSRRFIDYWNSNFSDDPCKRDTDTYMREYRNDYLARERELLIEYKNTHGILPRCNDMIP